MIARPDPHSDGEPLPPSPVQPQPEWPVPTEELIGKGREPHAPHPHPEGCVPPGCFGGVGGGLPAIPPTVGGGGPRNPAVPPIGGRKDPPVPEWQKQCAADPLCS